MIISPYRTPDNGWVFDDPARGLVAEPLIAGADTLCDMLANGAETFTVRFDDIPVKNADTLILTQGDSEKKESWYYSVRYNIIAYFCPALFRYFPSPPQKIYYSVISYG